MDRYKNLCPLCQDYDDAWDITCFCPECQEKIKKQNGHLDQIIFEEVGCQWCHKAFKIDQNFEGQVTCPYCGDIAITHTSRP